MNTLPEELPVLVISELDTTPIERFAGVSRRVRVLEPGYGGIYFHISLSTVVISSVLGISFERPQIPDLELLTLVVKRVLFYYRRVYVGQPRIRLDGVYIAICHYMFVLLLYQNADFRTLTLLS